MSPTIYAMVVAGAILFAIATIGALVLLVLDARTASRLRRRLGLGGSDATEEFDGADHKQLLEGFARRGQSLAKLVGVTHCSRRSKGTPPLVP